ncbi:hypothetical protein [Streptomyces sp. NPDC047014]|uniref:hypothetical protein n=1 Tax=Streptomyces sp. NPDC047014 TaxID=3155736 RepID=UPI0033DFFCE8
MSGNTPTGDTGQQSLAWEPVTVPGPEPDWRPAPEYQLNPNPTQQYGIWDSIALIHRPIGVLPPPLKAYAARLVLEVEQSWEDRGRVDAASFRLGGYFLVLSQFPDLPDTGVTIWLDRRHTDTEAALARLVRTMDIPADHARDTTWSPHPATQHEPPPPPPSRRPRFLRIRRK